HDEQCRVGIFQLSPGRQHSVASPSLLRLERKSHQFVLTDFCANRSFHLDCLMSNHNINLLGLQGECCSNHMRDDRTTIELVKHLRLLGLHSSSQSGCHDKYVERMLLLVGGQSGSLFNRSMVYAETAGCETDCCQQEKTTFASRSES